MGESHRTHSFGSVILKEQFLFLLPVKSFLVQYQNVYLLSGYAGRCIFSPRTCPMRGRWFFDSGLYPILIYV